MNDDHMDPNQPMDDGYEFTAFNIADPNDLPPAGHGMVRIPAETWHLFEDLCRQGRIESQEVAALERMAQDRDQDA